MKKFFFVLVALFSLSAVAEHDATYCGQFNLNARALSEYGDKLDAVIRVKCESFIEQKAYYGYAGLLLSNDQLQRVAKFVRTGRPTTEFCVKARWGGPNPCQSTSLRSIRTLTDNVQRVDYASRF